MPASWIQLSSQDNVVSRAWENFVEAFAQINEHMAQDFKEIGFPDTEDKRNQFYSMFDRGLSIKQYIVVLDDFHLVKEPKVIDYIEHIIYHMPQNRKTVIIISREPPQINLFSLQVRGLVSYIYEEDLNFTENEVAQYLSQQNLSVDARILREIYQDTCGWAIAVNFIAQSLKKSLNYTGYVRSAMMKNFFLLMDTEVFSRISEQLQHFMVCLSLIEHHSADLVVILAEEDKDMPAELENQSAFIRFDSNINSYMIHHMFLDFLRSKQEFLTKEEVRRTYQIAADWCNRSGFTTDAMSYYEKIGDYKSIVSVLYNLPLQLPHAIASYVEQIFSEAPAIVLEQVKAFAGTHMRIVISLGKLKEALKLAAYYEERLLCLPENSNLKNRTLGGFYYTWGVLKQLMCTSEDHCDFDVYFSKMNECLKDYTFENDNLPNLSNYPVGPWLNLSGSARHGAPEEYIDSLARAAKYASSCFNGCMAGADDLARGELKYYQSDVRSAESFIAKGLSLARSQDQFGLVHRALSYMLRIAVSQGNFEKGKQALEETEALLDKNNYVTRFLDYDINLGAYYNYALQPNRVTSWMRDKFSPFDRVFFNENSANQVKAQYYYITENYIPLLDYIDEQKNRASPLFCRIDMCVMEACVLFKMKNKGGALSALYEAYEIAMPNALLMPFICFGKDMCSLIAVALRTPNNAIPKSWLEMVEKKSAAYAKHHNQFISEYKKAYGINGDVTLSTREKEILRYLCDGLTRSEIAAKTGLSINTVKHYINNIYEKLNARNVADVIRIAIERNLI
jgi:LuxR family maltose regulon positive regulatory protein